jgi:hypothetical protein
MAGEAREILRLHRCPGCNYDLTGLPAAHRCPECGFEYDETMFDLEAWWPSVLQRVLDSSWVDMLLGAAAIIALLSVGLRLAAVGLAILLMILVATLVGSFLRHRVQQEGIPDIILVIDDDGFVTRRPGARVGRRELWRRLSGARVRRSGASFWQLHLTRDSLLSSIVDSPIRFVIAGDRRTAALVRNEIRRRIRAAQAGRLCHPCERAASGRD